MDIADEGGIKQRFRFGPELVAGFPVALGVGDQGCHQLQNVFFRVDIAEGVVVHRLLEVDGVQDFDAVIVPEQRHSALGHDTALRERSVKIENGKVTNNFQFRNSPFSHRHA